MARVVLHITSPNSEIKTIEESTSNVQLSNVAAALKVVKERANVELSKLVDLKGSDVTTCNLDEDSDSSTNSSETKRQRTS